MCCNVLLSSAFENVSFTDETVIIITGLPAFSFESLNFNNNLQGRPQAGANGPVVLGVVLKAAPRLWHLFLGINAVNPTLQAENVNLQVIPSISQKE